MRLKPPSTGATLKILALPFRACGPGSSGSLVFLQSLSTGSHYLAPRGEERLQAFRRIKASYGVRSQAVHGERMSKDKLASGMHDAFDILRILLLHCVLRGSVATDEDIYRELLC